MGENRPGRLTGETGFLDFHRSGKKPVLGNENTMTFDGKAESRRVIAQLAEMGQYDSAIILCSLAEKNWRTADFGRPCRVVLRFGFRSECDRDFADLSLLENEKRPDVPFSGGVRPGNHVKNAVFVLPILTKLAAAVAVVESVVENRLPNREFEPLPSSLRVVEPREVFES